MQGPERFPECFLAKLFSWFEPIWVLATRRWSFCVPGAPSSAVHTPRTRKSQPGDPETATSVLGLPDLGANLPAERVGFEPTEACTSHAFQACRFGHSRTSPRLCAGPWKARRFYYATFLRFGNRRTRRPQSFKAAWSGSSWLRTERCAWVSEKVKASAKSSSRVLGA